MIRPVIAITGRRWPAHKLDIERRYQAGRFDMHFSAFAEQIARAGGVPIQLPYESAGPEIIARIDGLVISGGQDVDPRIWGGVAFDAAADYDPDRDHCEVDLLRRAVEARLPVLGICRGLQVMNIAFGGTLVEDLPTTDIDHLQVGLPVDQDTHDVEFTPGSIAASIYGEGVRVNSLHHQAVLAPGTGITVTGRAFDGVTEAIELAGHHAIGVQWHPEWRRRDPAFDWIVAQSRGERHAAV